MAQIVISYARSTEPKAQLIAESLRALGYSVWRDDDLTPGRTYAQEIEERVRVAQAVVVAWSTDALRSEWVRAEADLARQQGMLVQVSLDGVLPPLPFNQIHCVDLSGWGGNPTAPGWQKLTATIAGLLNQAPMDVDVMPSLPDKPSVAALPFANHCSDQGQDYFVEGMLEEIITALTRIRSLFVIASSATMSLKDSALDPQRAARRLGVQYILEGSVRRAGSKVRIAVKLTDTSSGAQIWADRFEDTLEDVFALQDRVALSVAGAIEPSIRAAELRRVARSPVENLGCYDLYLRASHLRAALRKQEVMQALELLKRALALQPDFAPALAQAAGCHSQIYLNRWTEDRDAHRREGLAMAERAERAGGDDAAVLTQVANALADLENNVDRSIAIIDRATALNPGSAYAWFVSGFLRIMNGQGRAAVGHFERTARLDPISPLSDVARVHMAVAEALEGEFEESLRIFRGTSYRTPRVHMTLACVCAQLNQWPQAHEEMRLYVELTPTPPEVMAAHSFRNPVRKAWAIDMIAQIRKSE